MAKNETALDRLERTKVPSAERDYTLEEQMESVSTDDFLDGMSDVARDNLDHLFEEVSLDDNTESTESTENNVNITDNVDEPIITESLSDPAIPIAEPIIEQPILNDPEPEIVEPTPVIDSGSRDELFNNNTKPKRGRKKSEETNESTTVSSQPMNYSSNPVLDQLAKDVIDDLRNRHHKINRFDDKSMEMIFNYMYSKF